MRYAAILCLITMEVVAAENVLADYFSALHWVEAEWKVGPIKGKDGELGPLQIREGFWKDSKVPGKYSDCADLEYSKRVAIAYYEKWCPMALEMRDYEIMARIHNGGPKGHRRSSTLPYWRKVRSMLNQRRR